MGGSARSSLTTPRRAACESNLNKSYFASHVFSGNLLFSPLKEIRDNTDKSSYYSYIKNYATKQYNSMIKPYQISQISYYTGLSMDNKREVVKKFVKNYGAVFAGIQGSSRLTGSVGCFYRDTNAENVSDGIYISK